MNARDYGLGIVTLEQRIKKDSTVDIYLRIKFSLSTIQAVHEVLMGSLAFDARAGIKRKPLHHIADGVPAVLGELGLEMRAQAEGLAQERLQVSPIPQGLARRGQLELEGEADGAHKAVERSGALVAREAPALAERLERHVRDLPARELAGIDSQHRLAARLIEHAHDIHLVGIPRDGAEKALASAQTRREPENAVQGNGAVDDVRPFRIAGETPHLILEHLDPERRVAARVRVAERPPLAQLLEPPDVVQQAGQPREVDVGRGQALPSRDLVAQLGNLIGVFDLERDPLIRDVVTSDI